MTVWIAVAAAAVLGSRGLPAEAIGSEPAGGCSAPPAFASMQCTDEESGALIAAGWMLSLIRALAPAACVFCALLLGSESVASCPEPGASQQQLSFADRQRIFSLYIPPAAQAPSASSPLLVLLHGSFQRGDHILRMWIELADREGLILAAPQALDESAWHIRADGPAFIREVVEAIAARCAVDRRRTYLFGDSGGAVYALTLALIESEYFAAAAVHAGAWRAREDFAVVSYAKRKIPVSIFVGDIDELFSVRSVRQTERALRDAGHPVNVTIMKGHGHAYGRVAPKVNAAAWAFLQPVSLESDPRGSSQAVDQPAAGTASNAMVVRGTEP